MKTSDYSVFFDYENDATYVVDNDNISFGAPLYKALQHSTSTPHKDADDYSIWNPENGAPDMLQAGSEIFGDNFLKLEYELDGFSINEDENQVILTNLEELELQDKEQEILSFMEQWENENASYTEADYIIWSDGSGYKVIMLDEDYASSCSTMEMCDDFESRKVLQAFIHAAFEKCSWNHGKETGYYGGYEFVIPEGSYHFEYCSVRKMDEDECIETAEVAYDLDRIESTPNGTGYPEHLKDGLIGFRTLGEVQECADKFGLQSEIYHKRDGWQLWQRTGSSADMESMKRLYEEALLDNDEDDEEENLEEDEMVNVYYDTHTWVAGVIY